MYNIVISALLAVITFVIAMPVAGLAWWIGLLLAVVVFLLSFVLIARFVMKKVEAIMTGAMRDLQVQRVTSKEMQVALVDKAIREMKEALKYADWQIYVSGQINSSIGMLHYIKRDFSGAFPYLEKGFFKNWVTMGMLAITYLKRQKKDKMKDTFEKGVIGSPKESLLWALYAYCMCEVGDQDKAKEILERGLKKVAGDEQLTQNLSLLKDGKKMKMTGYGEMWYQFHLENPATIQKQQLAAMGGVKRRVIRK
ncbi:MAG TPA: hypothetical protein VIU41_00900 [Geobacteraceae bacterium]